MFSCWKKFMLNIVYEHIIILFQDFKRFRTISIMYMTKNSKIHSHIYITHFHITTHKKHTKKIKFKKNAHITTENQHYPSPKTSKKITQKQKTRSERKTLGAKRAESTEKDLFPKNSHNTHTHTIFPPDAQWRERNGGSRPFSASRH